MHQNSSFQAQKSQIFLGRRPSPAGKGHPSPHPTPLGALHFFAVTTMYSQYCSGQTDRRQTDGRWQRSR